jgi:hypothetical protein
MDEIKLKPCPFCGGEAQIKDTHVYMDEAIKIYCSRCACSIFPVLINHPRLTARGLNESTRYTREQAINEAAKKWNRRTLK